jgi:hypothetical protein
MIEPYDQEPSVFKRCRMADAEDESSMSVRSRFFFQTEHSCELLAVTAVPGGYKVRARCVHHADIADTPDSVPLKDIKGEVRVERWRLLANGHRLEAK